MSYDGSLSYFEYYERKGERRPVAHDLVEFPDIVVTESEMPEPEIPLIKDDQ